MSVEKRVAAYLELATKDVEAAELLVAGGNRYAAYHVQQAVEKLTKAARRRRVELAARAHHRSRGSRRAPWAQSAAGR